MAEPDHIEHTMTNSKMQLLGSPLVSTNPLGANEKRHVATSGSGSGSGSGSEHGQEGHQGSYSESGRAEVVLLSSDAEEEPVFRRHEESTTIELFYDLFFVANLATFSGIHEIQTTDTLTSYIGYFCVLWFTWCLTSLHDIRFVSDSLVGRAAKGVHLGVMVGLAVAGPKYAAPDHPVAFRVLSLILMVSRLMLGLQYFLVLYHVRNYRNSKTPFAIIGGFSVVAALVYLGVGFAKVTSDVVYAAFYVVAAAEMVVNIGVAAQWKVASFAGTNLIERMSLLTLYILGEGVIDVARSTSRISQQQDHWSRDDIGTLLSAILALYLFYMLYFDSLDRSAKGSFRQQIWSFAHFPFHAALVLCVTGMAQFVIWEKIFGAFGDFADAADDVFSNFLDQNKNLILSSGTDLEALATSLIGQINGTVQASFKTFPPADPLEAYDALNEIYETVSSTFTTEAKLDPSGTFDNTSNALLFVDFKVLTVVMTTFGFEAPENGEGGEGEGGGEDAADSSVDDLVSRLDVADLFYGYFFLSTGWAIIILGVLGLINNKRWTWRYWLSFGTHIVMGLALCLMDVLLIDDAEPAEDFATTSWPLPLVALVLLVVISVHHLSIWGDDRGSSEHKRRGLFTRWRRARAEEV